MGDIRSLSSDGQLQGCGIPKSLSKQILRPEKNDKDALRVALPTTEPSKQRLPVAVATTKPSVPDCTVSTSAASHSWHPASPGAPRPKRSSAPPKPLEGRRAEAQADVELDNMNRNNSSEVKMATAVALAVPGQPTKWTSVPRGPRPHQAPQHYMTVPAGGLRMNRRHSVNADLYRERCYVAYPKTGASLRSKRSLSMSGELPQLDSTTNIHRARDKLSRSEWLLESTLWLGVCSLLLFSWIGFVALCKTDGIFCLVWSFFRSLWRDLWSPIIHLGRGRHTGLWESLRVCFLSYNLSKIFFIMIKLWWKAQQIYKTTSCTKVFSCVRCCISQYDRKCSCGIECSNLDILYNNKDRHMWVGGCGWGGYYTHSLIAS